MSRSLDLLFICSTFPPLTGGAETYALTLAEGMSDRGHRVTVVTDGTGSSPPLPTDRDGSEAGYRLARLSEYRRLFDGEGAIPWEVLAFGLLSELERELSDSTIDLVVTNSLDAASLGKLVSLDRDIPWAASFHEQSPELASFGEATLELVYDVLRPDLVLAGSDFYARRAREHGAGDRTCLIEHGVDTKLFQPAADAAAFRHRHGIPPDAKVLLCAGRLTPRKGMPDLLDAAAHLSSRFPSLRVVIAGTINSSNRVYAESLRERVGRLGIDDRVTFDESAGPTEMPAAFCAADVVVQPSYAEGLGLAVLEAMSCGRPVVTTDTPATGEITKGAEVLSTVGIGDIERLADAIAILLEDPGRAAALGEAARRHVIERFSREAMLEATEGALLALVEPAKETVRGF